jgi:hypothetical protein
VTTQEAAKLVERLNDLMANFEDVIRRKAEDLAEPMIRDAEARAQLAAMGARSEVQRERDLVAELRKRIAVADRMRDDLNAARRVLAAALGEPAGALPLSYFVDRAAAAIEARRGSDAR